MPQQKDLPLLYQIGGQLAERDRQAMAAQKEAEQAAKLKEYLMGVEAQQKQTGIEQNQQMANELRKQYGDSTGIKVGDVSIQPRDASADMLRQLQMQNLQDERKRKSLQDLGDRSVKAGTAQMVPALKRGEQEVPGLFTSEQPIKFKSVGGVKNLAPDVIVKPLESLGIMEKGASTERAALRDLANMKIYDSSGKQINEQEMQRLASAMGLNGISDPESITSALRQMGYTVQQKQQQVVAGAQPADVAEFKKQGGLAGAKSLSELLGMGVGPNQPASMPQVPQQETEEQEYLRLRKKHKGF